MLHVSPRVPARVPTQGEHRAAGELRLELGEAAQLATVAADLGARHVAAQRHEVVEVIVDNLDSFSYI